MKQIILPVGVIGLMIASAACSKKVAVATPPPASSSAPVASTPAPARTPPARQTPRPAQPKQTIAQTPARRTTPTAAERATLNQSLARLEDALFDFDKSTIRTDASVALKDDVGVIRDILKNYPSQKLLIEGHADERGSQEYNLALGDRRAHAVQEFLTSMGIPDNQLTIVSYGKDRPVCTDETESCWQRNRRAHVTAAE
ncbi:MAG TPA: OmpA family protein [Bryobacteraceae bacterium]|jgi:peptidoglycan-associated lipoprotein